MNRRQALSLLAATSACAVLRVDAAENRKPFTASWLKGGNTGSAGLGVYLGAGCKGTERLRTFQEWLGRDVDQTLEFLGWKVLSGRTSWGVNCWNKAAQAVVYSIPMLPWKTSLREGANGKFDDLFRNYGALLVKQGYEASVLRIGWEFNANWYAWSATKDPQAYVDYWRRIVSIFRETPGAKFKFDWCPAASARGFSADRAYPGDDVVDFIGLDFYNMPVDGKMTSPEERWLTRMNMHHGLKWHREFAQSHRKRMSFPEWGTGKHTQYVGADDDAYFIEQMAAWIADSPVAYHNYWEYKSKQLDTRLSTGAQPKAAAAFRKFFGRDARAELHNTAMGGA